MDVHAIYEAASRIYARQGGRYEDAVAEAIALWDATWAACKRRAATSRTPGADRAITPTAAQAAGAV